MRTKSSVLSILVISLLMFSSLMISVSNGANRTSNSVASAEYSLISQDTTVIFADDFENDSFVPVPKGDFPGNVGTFYPSGSTRGMLVGDDAYGKNYSRDCWGVSSYRSHSGNNSLWCAQYGLASWGYDNSTANSAIHRIDQDMLTYYENWFNLSDYDSVTLSFWYWIQSSCPTNTWKFADHLQIHLFNGTWSNYWSVAGNNSWTHVTLNIPTNMKLIGFYYVRNLVNRALFEGAYVDDVLLVGHKKPPASVLIGDAYHYSASVGSASVGPNHFTLITNASWLSIASSNATVANLSGTPTHKGLYSVSLKVNDSFSVTWKNWTVEVYDVLKFNSSLAVTSVPFGDPYWFNISIQQNVFAKPNAFAIITNATWLVIDWQNDTQINVSGIASVEGNFSVSLVVNNSYSICWKNWTIAVGPEPPDPIWLYFAITGAIAAIALLSLFLYRKRNRRRVQRELSRKGRASSDIAKSKNLKGVTGKTE